MKLSILVSLCAVGISRGMNFNDFNGRKRHSMKIREKDKLTLIKELSQGKLVTSSAVIIDPQMYNFNCMDLFGRVPLIESYKHQGNIALLLNAFEASPDFKDSRGDVLLSRLFKEKTNITPETLLVILEKMKEAAEFVDMAGQKNLLHLCLSRYPTEMPNMVRALMMKGVPLNETDGLGFIPIDYACIKGWFRSFALLLPESFMPSSEILRCSTPCEAINRLIKTVLEREHRLIFEFWILSQIIDECDVALRDPLLDITVKAITDRRWLQNTVDAVVADYDVANPGA